VGVHVITSAVVTVERLPLVAEGETTAAQVFAAIKVVPKVAVPLAII
jgi:hypothetical protein